LQSSFQLRSVRRPGRSDLLAKSNGNESNKTWPAQSLPSGNIGERLAGVEGIVIDTVLNLLFRCAHRHLMRPFTPLDKQGVPHGETRCCVRPFTITAVPFFCQRCHYGQADSGRRPRNQSSLVQHIKCEYSNAQGSALSRCEPFTVWGTQWITLIP
jgi:hypothetical protein